MSPRNWKVCPQCEFRQKKLIEKAQAKVSGSYGKVSAKEYELMLRRLESLKKWPVEQTLGEYYELTFHEKGKFEVDYSAGCQKCGFEHSHNSLSQFTVAASEESESSDAPA